jgi:16S rRNA processing protein RimM
VIGRFGRPRGVSGEIYITPATDDPARFAELREIIIVGSDQRRTVSLNKAAVIGGRPVVKIEGIDSREEAAKLTGLSIEIPVELLRPLPDGRYYQFDLVGCRVAGADGTDYGVIEEVMFYPASDLYRIVSERFGEVLFPAVDRYVIRIDIDGKKIIIDPPAGLFVPKEDTS